MLLFQEEELLSKLELELEIQDKICKAASRLIKDNSVNKTARKQRRQSYHRAHQKVSEGEARGGGRWSRCALLDEVKASSWTPFPPRNRAAPEDWISTCKMEPARQNSPSHPVGLRKQRAALPTDSKHEANSSVLETKNMPSPIQNICFSVERNREEAERRATPRRENSRQAAPVDRRCVRASIGWV